MQHLKVYNKQDLLTLTRLRRFETKLGERLRVVSNAQDLNRSLNESTAKYVIVGVPEDIGVKANLGIGGADTAWVSFLQSFLNIQSNDFLPGDNILLLGHFDFSDLCLVIEENAGSYEEKTEAYRHAVHTIDDEVEHIVKLVTEHKN